MTGKVVNLPFKLKPAEPFQLDLFDMDKFLVGKYSFLDVNDCNQDEFFQYITKLRFKLVIDIRIFPSFDRPKYEHSKVLSILERSNVFYFPAVYLKYTNNLYSQIYHHKSVIRAKSEQGPVLLLHEKEKSKEKSLERWRIFLEKRMSGSKELHPRSIERLYSWFGDF